MAASLGPIVQALTAWQLSVDTIHAQQLRPNPAPSLRPKRQLLTLAQLRAAMPNASEADVEKYLPYLNEAMDEFGITTPQRQAAFLAQIGWESGDLKYMNELGTNATYAGRGPIQLTGRANYAAAGDALGIDLVNNPAKAADPAVGFRVAGWFWSSHNLNSSADAGNFSHITRVINGGTNGAAGRNTRYQAAMSALTETQV